MSSNSGPYMIGVDFGTESVRAGIFGLDGYPIAAQSTVYKLSHPRPGWAEQDPSEWWSALGESVRGAMKAANVKPDAIAGISCDATTCTVVAVDSNDKVIRPAIMWMDVRAADQAE